MRRSGSVVLTLLAVTALTACDSKEDTDVAVPNVGACMERFGSSSAAECENAFAAARQSHVATAPQFPSVEACREQTGGDCQIAPTTTRAADGSLVSTAAGVAIPVMAGVLIGKVLSDGMRPTMPLYAGRSPQDCPPGSPPGACAPAQRTGGGGGSGFVSYYSGGSYAGQSQGPMGRTGSAFTPSAATSTSLANTARTSVTRGGLGASARGFGGSVGA